MIYPVNRLTSRQTCNSAPVSALILLVSEIVHGILWFPACADDKLLTPGSAGVWYYWPCARGSSEQHDSDRRATRQSAAKAYPVFC
jgi:hypothetical protein